MRILLQDCYGCEDPVRGLFAEMNLDAKEQAQKGVEEDAQERSLDRHQEQSLQSFPMTCATCGAVTGTRDSNQTRTSSCT
jgi:hypothetical protein